MTTATIQPTESHLRTAQFMWGFGVHPYRRCWIGYPPNWDGRTESMFFIYERNARKANDYARKGWTVFELKRD